MRKITAYVILTVLVFVMASCASKKNLHSTREKEMTLGIVQRDIRAGMSQPDVAEALGSPNIVTKDSEGNETWIYDKIATEASYSASGAYWTLFIIGGSSQKGYSATTQKTLTVVIKFDRNGAVKTVSYHASKF